MRKISLSILFLFFILSGCATLNSDLSKDDTFSSIKEKEKKEQAKNNLIDESYGAMKDKEQSEADIFLNKYYVNEAKDESTKPLTRFQKFVKANAAFNDYVDVNFSTKQNLGYILYSVLDEYNMIVKVGNGVSLDYPGFVRFRGPLYKFLEVLFEPYGYYFEYEKPNIIYVKAFDTRTYDLEFLNIVHDYKIDFSASSSGQTSGFGTESGGGQSAQNLTLVTTSQNVDIWESVQNEINSILSTDGRSVINKDLGKVTVTDRVPFLERVEDYVKSINDLFKKQIFLDVTLVEVHLSNKYQYGVDWGFLEATGSDHAVSLHSNLNPGFTDTVLNVPNPQAPSLDKFRVDIPIFTVENARGLTKFIIGGLEEFGKVNVKAHPKQLVLNNQPAIIPIGTNITYLRSLEKDESSWGYGNAGDVDWYFETGTLLDGVTLQFLPKATSNNTITMQVSVLLNKLLEMQSIKVGEELQLQLPQTSARADSTIVKLKSGSTMVIGGLLREDVQNTTRQIPILGDIPYLGNLFKYKAQNKDRVELVLILTAKIINM
jgi:MSHA type pilus biogenesis protein MshL